LYVCDGDVSAHQPGYRSVSDAASKSANVADLETLRDAARRERSRWIARMVDAWRMPRGSVVAGPGQQRQTDPSQINRSALSHQPGNRPDDASEPDAGSRPWEIAAHERGEPDHDLGAAMARHQRRRDSAWEDYRQRLGSAYLQGRRDPAAHARTFDPTQSHSASRIEAQREKWTAER
jgi:hypothetical protein